MAAPQTPVTTPPASLYVGDLHPDVTDDHLYDAFSEFKSLDSVRVCRDSSTGRSLCYGYVNFISPQDAVQAIELKNHSTLNGKVIRVSWSRRDPDIRRSGVGNVFVKNLSDVIDNTKLQEMFLRFGNILSCKVAMSDDGKSKGYGFVQFESEDSAIASIEQLNGSLVEGKQLYVGKFIKKSERILLSPDAKYTNLYIKNLDHDITVEHLREKFSEFGKIASLAISKDVNGASKGFGFICFENPDDAKQAQEAMDGTQLGSKKLYVARAQKKAEREQILQHQFDVKRKEQIMKFQASNVYVKNIDDGITEDELQELFSQCGSITSAKLMRDDKGMSKGFGFVCFSTPEAAVKAVATLHGFMFHRKPLYVSFAQRKEERQAQLQLQYAQRMTGPQGSSAIFPGRYPPIYYPAHGIVPPVSVRPGLVYQPLGMRPSWRAKGFVNSTRPSFQTSPVPMFPNATRQHRQNRGRVQGNIPAQYAAHVQPTQSVALAKESVNQQRAGQGKYVSSGSLHDMNKASTASTAVPIPDGSGAEGPEMLSSLLAAASPEQQKQILGERLYPLVSERNPDLAAKITGMLLEMDNSELLLLLESPESLAAKVEEALQVLKLSKAKISNPDAIHPNYISAEGADALKLPIQI
ncbi:PREDICTED: polyadenylate-binding protein 7 isoform X1 [Ipomoea nil]|uniref:polyadenylate-binding protein 7 isoform X1 n=1 Tax=Ipomoea nil TaxID=35883 RepID=UPI000900CC66|nr:PREDICTED: polyadenylate-binding protein 7 isoform X1 [Ipomoea nil]